MKALLLALVAIAATGCSAPDSPVTVGEPGQKGVIRTDIDRSKTTAQEATQRVLRGNQDLSDSKL